VTMIKWTKKNLSYQNRRSALLLKIPHPMQLV